MMGAGRAEVIAAYRLILGREPESEAAIQAFLGVPRPHLLTQFLASTEGQMACPTVHFAALPVHLQEYQVFRGYSEVDLAIFRAFPLVTRAPEPGFIVDFLGNRTRTAVSTAFAALDGQVMGYPVPGDYFADACEWLGLLKAVLGATNRLRIAELGAGWGPWIVAAHAAAQQRGITDIRLYALEGNAAHMRFMRQHCQDNAIDPDAHVLLTAAIGPESGTTRWPLVDAAEAAAHYGLRPVAADGQDYHGRLFDAFVDVPMVGITDLLAREETWDVLHIDVQGLESTLCEVAAEALSQQVAWLIIGTHSRRIDGDLMALFHAQGWVLEHDRPTSIRWNADAVTLESMATTDGTQVWRNPRLAAPVLG